MSHILPLYKGHNSPRRWHNLFLLCVLSLFVSWHIILLFTHPITSKYFYKVTGSQRIVWSNSSLIPEPRPVNLESDRHLVVAGLKDDDVNWIEENLPDWKAFVYKADDYNATLHPPANKGNEAMVYLTYIIDNYDKLAETSVFMHSLRYQWHNDDPMYDGVPIIQRLNTSLVQTEGYVNLRCTWWIGCPSQIELSPKDGEDHGLDEHNQIKYDLAKNFGDFFPATEMPSHIGSSCCSTFAASREVIRRRSRSQYIRYRDYLLTTQSNNAVSGRVFEYIWHMIFGKPAQYCPKAQDCYCKVFGLCELKCTGEGQCDGQYRPPPGMSMPPGWPENRPEGWGVAGMEDELVGTDG
ncbi:MAG: hypothetical protein M1814_000771 [Vezdaea aestivalis]|nr:MAG: hypothetical protein M1814_000771 [Vezdaea aestivalis]